MGRPEFAAAASAPEVTAESHSHLNLAMHGVRDGATATIPGLMQYCSDGRLSIEIIQHVDKDMADHCQRGLLWEVLSYMMAVEEPTAFEIIQAALNAKNSSGLMEHEMEHLNGLATVIADLGSGMADQFNWRLVRERAIQSGNIAVAECSEFPMLCQMVCHALAQHACGTASASASYNHWAEMKKWHETMINPKTRRVRLSNLAQLAHVPPEHPRLRNALFRLAYSGKSPSAEQIRTGQIFLKTLTSLTHMSEPELQPVFEMAEKILQHWHITYADEGAFRHLSRSETCRLWAMVEPRLVACLCKNSKPKQMTEALLEAASQEDKFLRKKIPRSVEQLLPQLECCRGDTNASENAADRRTDAAVAVVGSPAQLTVDEVGRVTGVPAVVPHQVPENVEEEIDFAKTEESADLGRLKSELLVGVWMARNLLEKPPVKVFGIRGLAAGKKTFLHTKVVVTRDVAAFEVVLVPMVKGMEAVTQKAGGKSSAVAVEMINPSSSKPVPGDGESPLAFKTTLYLIPCRVDADGKDRFMPPSWCVKQGTREEANMASDEVDVDAMLTLLYSDELKSQVRPSINNTVQFPIPVMTNFRALPKGTELVFAKAAVAEKPQNKKDRPKTWLPGATIEFKADRKKSG